MNLSAACCSIYFLYNAFRMFIRYSSTSESSPVLSSFCSRYWPNLFNCWASSLADSLSEFVGDAQAPLSIGGDCALCCKWDLRLTIFLYAAEGPVLSSAELLLVLLVWLGGCRRKVNLDPVILGRLLLSTVVPLKTKLYIFFFFPLANEYLSVF